MPCPGRLGPQVAARQAAASASSSAPRAEHARAGRTPAERTGRSRTWPSAVSRVRSQSPSRTGASHRGDDADLPADRRRPPTAPQAPNRVAPGRVVDRSDGAARQARRRRRWLRPRFHSWPASSGICSMMRSWYPWSRQNRSRAMASSSPVTGCSTAFTFSGLSPATFAASSPASTSSSRSRRVMLAKRAASMVSSETFIRSSPARLSLAARLSSPMPLVVNVISAGTQGRGRRDDVLEVLGDQRLAAGDLVRS